MIIIVSAAMALGILSYSTYQLTQMPEEGEIDLEQGRDLFDDLVMNCEEEESQVYENVFADNDSTISLDSENQSALEEGEQIDLLLTEEEFDNGSAIEVPAKLLVQEEANALTGSLEIANHFTLHDLQEWEVLDLLEEAAEHVKNHHYHKCLRDLREITHSEDYLVDPAAYLHHLIEESQESGDVDTYLMAIVLNRLHSIPEYLDRLE